MPKIASCQGQHLHSVAVKISDLIFDSKATIAVTEFLKFTPVDDTPGENIANIIISVMESLKFDLTKLRGQGYDGASNMAGKIKGGKTRILEKFPLAQYSHCSSHALNLVIMSGCKHQKIQNMIGIVKTITNFIREPYKTKLFQIKLTR